MEEEPKNQIQIEIDDATAKGTYSNLAFITHSETEFVIDFVFHQPQAPKTRVLARVVCSPVHMKRLAAAVQDNLHKYEARFGEINASPGQAPPKAGGYFH